MSLFQQESPLQVIHLPRTLFVNATCKWVTNIVMSRRLCLLMSASTSLSATSSILLSMPIQAIRIRWHMALLRLKFFCLIKVLHPLHSYLHLQDFTMFVNFTLILLFSFTYIDKNPRGYPWPRNVGGISIWCFHPPRPLPRTLMPLPLNSAFMTPSYRNWLA